MTPPARRAIFSLIVFFAVCAVAGTFLQRRVGAQSSQDESQIRDNLKSFTDVYAIVEQNYAEPIQGDKADTAIYDGAIPGMLRVLDPHSNFYDPKAYAKMREDQRGHYYGVGMVIQQQNNKVYVITPYEGTPSFRAGLRPGDIISAIDGKSTEGMTSDTVGYPRRTDKAAHLRPDPR
jgi:carboxyl-terminal processing protease